MINRIEIKDEYWKKLAGSDYIYIIESGVLKTDHTEDEIREALKKWNERVS